MVESRLSAADDDDDEGVHGEHLIREKIIKPEYRNLSTARL